MEVKRLSYPAADFFTSAQYVLFELSTPMHLVYVNDCSLWKKPLGCEQEFYLLVACAFKSSW